MAKSFHCFTRLLQTLLLIVPSFGSFKSLQGTFCTKTIAVPNLDVFSIDSWDLTEQDKQIEFFRQVVSLSGETVPLEYIYQTTRHLIGRVCSTWVIFSDKPSPYQGNLFHSIKFMRHSLTILGEIAPLERFLQTNCFIPSNKTSFVNNQFPRRKRMIDSPCGFSVYGCSFLLCNTHKWRNLLSNTCSENLPQNFITIQVASIFTFVLDRSVKQSLLKLVR